MASRALIVKIALLAALYIVLAKLGIELSVAHGVITPVWAPTGLSLAALLLFGYRLWPGIAVGAFIANATSDLSVGLAAAIAVGNTLEAVVGTYLLRRVNFENSLERVRDVLALVVFGAFLATMVSATNGVTTLWLGGELEASQLGSEWVLWWFGDAVGALLVAPALLTWLSGRRTALSGHPIEAALLAVGIGVASSFVFLGGNWKYPYLLFPLLVWAAIRFKQQGATTAVLIVGVIGTVGTVQGAVPIGGATETESVQILQALIAVVAIAVFIIAATIAERDYARAELDTALAGLSDAQALAHVGSWEWDIRTGRVTWSDEMYRIHGFQPQEFEPTFESALEHIVPEDRSRIRDFVESAVQAGRDHNLPAVEYTIRRPDGTRGTVVAKGQIKFSREGEPLCMVGTVEDISESVEAQRELAEAFRREREAGDRLRELDQIKNTFISAVSHDLRTPLTVIVGLTDALMKRLDKLDRADVMEIVSHMNTSAIRAAHVLQNLLDVDRVSSGAVEPVRDEVDLGELVARTALGLEAEARSRIEVPPKGVTAWVDEGLAERIIDNLLLNAIRHTPKDTAIWARVVEQDGGVVLCVEDEGPGVPDDLKRIVFEPFERGPGSSVVGSGVGLYLVARFAELHGGRAWVEDRDGGGASFRVFFPNRREGAEEVPA